MDSGEYVKVGLIVMFILLLMLIILTELAYRR